MTRYPYRKIRTELPITMEGRRWELNCQTVTIEIKTPEEAAAVIRALIDQTGRGKPDDEGDDEDD